MKLTHTQAYLLGSLAKHSDNYRRAIDSLQNSLNAGKASDVRRGINIDAANKADYAQKVVDELLDQLYEEFADIEHGEISRIVNFALAPTERGSRRRFSVDDEV